MSMSSVPCGMGKRGEGIDTSTFYSSGYVRDRSKVKVWELSSRRCIASAVPIKRCFLSHLAGPPALGTPYQLTRIVVTHACRKLTEVRSAARPRTESRLPSRRLQATGGDSHL